MELGKLYKSHKEIKHSLVSFSGQFSEPSSRPSSPSPSLSLRGRTGGQGPGLLQIQGIKNFEPEHCTCTKRWTKNDNAPSCHFKFAISFDVLSASCLHMHVNHWDMKKKCLLQHVYKRKQTFKIFLIFKWFLFIRSSCFWHNTSALFLTSQA